MAYVLFLPVSCELVCGVKRRVPSSPKGENTEGRGKAHTRKALMHSTLTSGRVEIEVHLSTNVTARVMAEYVIEDGRYFCLDLQMEPKEAEKLTLNEVIEAIRVATGAVELGGLKNGQR